MFFSSRKGKINSYCCHPKWCFFVNKLRAVNFQLSKYKLIDGGRKTCLCHTEKGVGTDPDDRQALSPLSQQAKT